MSIFEVTIHSRQLEADYDYCDDEWFRVYSLGYPSASGGTRRLVELLISAILPLGFLNLNTKRRLFMGPFNGLMKNTLSIDSHALSRQPKVVRIWLPPSPPPEMSDPRRSERLQGRVA